MKQLKWIYVAPVYKRKKYRRTATEKAKNMKCRTVTHTESMPWTSSQRPGHLLAPMTDARST